MSFLKVDLANLHTTLQRMDEAAQSAARPAAQAAAQVLYDRVQRNVRQLGRKTGKLEQAVYQAFSRHESTPGKVSYHVSWNPRKAPHGHLLEMGFIQRYVSYVGKDGNWYTAVRPSMRGKPKPKRRASQAVKDAYYVPLATPRQMPAHAFVRSAQAAFPLAVLSAELKLLEIIHGTGNPADHAA